MAAKERPRFTGTRRSPSRTASLRVVRSVCAPEDAGMVIPEHTAKAFDADLQELSRMVAEMGGLTEKQIADAVDALARRNSERAQQIVRADLSIDALQREIEDKAVLTIARRQ